MARNSALEQEMGPKKYREMIHKSSKEADNKNLPFTFLPKSKIKCSSRKGFVCYNCGHTMTGTKHTYMIICSNCKTVNKVSDNG